MRLESTTTVISDYNGWKGEELVKKVGSLYQPGRNVKDIAKDIRRIIREAVKAGFLPAMKTSVKIDRYSMGQSIDIRVTAIDETIINVDAWRAQAAEGYMLSWADCGGRYNAKGCEILGFLNDVLDAHRKSEDHGQSDYHQTTFHGEAAFDSDVTSEQAAALIGKA